MSSTIANRYADALFQLALEKQVVAEVNADLEEIVKGIETTPELVSLLTSPKFSNERKKQIIAEVFASANPIVVNTLELLIEKKRVDEIGNLAKSFKQLAAEAQGSADATVFSTRALTDQEKDEISSSFGKLVGKEKLTITNVIEPSILGGVRVQIGNYIFDNTVASKLDNLKRTLVG
ncbi:F0F1 ATP synthase subunit delta [Ureibacillus sinduriensis]|uniref:ATP synthase subunit delta n=1 Tax=Ureibacillus sinduriensis BLB-1 = JCM 15800 TaxID=1384057 RepID=A0A0A3I011_9BACL|nr:F0F1 ATP synthase subunit delta [Ureibacillus sinduriensis]KGR75978.1 ATP synthase F0F1 subunit delta [Ureibacillus sinduriensis BLB-1 = JCM 15800]